MDSSEKGEQPSYFDLGGFIDRGRTPETCGKPYSYGALLSRRQKKIKHKGEEEISQLRKDRNPSLKRVTLSLTVQRG